MITRKVREALRERSSGDPDTGLCEMCGARGNNAHHRKNQSQGGPDTLSNLLLLCGSGTTGCHGVVTCNPLWAWEHGYTVRSYETPSLKPVLIRLYGRVLLGDDGSIERLAA